MEWHDLPLRYKEMQVSGIERSDKIVSKELHCDPAFLKKATEPYTMISDIEVYKKKLDSCLKENDKKCLRGLISRTLQTSFGFDGYQDRRDYIFKTWKKSDFKRLRDMLGKGVIGEGDYRSFPPKPSDGGLGYRGELKKSNGGWLLVSFLAGD